MAYDLVDCLQGVYPTSSYIDSTISMRSNVLTDFLSNWIAVKNLHIRLLDPTIRHII